MFNAYFSSKINYGLEILGTANNSLIHKLQVKQNRALKILFNKDFHTPTRQLHYDLKVLTVTDTYKFNLGKFVYRQQSYLLPEIFNNHFTTVNKTHNHRTRQNDLLQTNHTGLNNHVLKMSTVEGAKIWNCIPKDIRTAKSLNIFKEQYKNHLMEQYSSDTD